MSPTHQCTNGGTNNQPLHTITKHKCTGKKAKKEEKFGILSALRAGNGKELYIGFNRLYLDLRFFQHFSWLHSYT